ncbi:MAG: NAD(P)/FAD-dependent oxidoreductase [Chloroflexi bacterium]|nr:NAD(P)/FAD-dependent oxidoreductase [Chloroflexota bacterium]
MPELSDDHRCIIIGGGPAGLACGLYFGRFNCGAKVIFREDQRARLIPRSWNVLGYPDGLAGEDFLESAQAHARKYGAELINGEVLSVQGASGGFRVHLRDGREFPGDHIILATGIEDVSPDIPNVDKYVGRGLRHCPICDGFEADGERLAILGAGNKVAEHSLFLRTFTDDITILFNGECEESDIDRSLFEKVKARGIRCLSSRVVKVIDEGREIRGFVLEDGATLEVDRAYSAIDCRPRTEVAVGMGVALNDRGFVKVDQYGRTSVKGVYAVGDVTDRGDAQIVIAMAQAATAAIHIHARTLSWNY